MGRSFTLSLYARTYVHHLPLRYVRTLRRLGDASAWRSHPRSMRGETLISIKLRAFLNCTRTYTQYVGLQTGNTNVECVCDVFCVVLRTYVRIIRRRRPTYCVVLWILFRGSTYVRILRTMEAFRLDYVCTYYPNQSVHLADEKKCSTYVLIQYRLV